MAGVHAVLLKHSAQGPVSDRSNCHKMHYLCASIFAEQTKSAMTSCLNITFYLFFLNKNSKEKVLKESKRGNSYTLNYMMCFSFSFSCT